MKTLEYASPWTGEIMKACFTTDRYVDGNGIYIGLLTYNDEYEFYEPWCDITVNIPYSAKLKENECFVDTNNCEGIDEWLVENNIAYYTGKFGSSGYCRYPIMVFNMNKVKEYAYSDRG